MLQSVKTEPLLPALSNEVQWIFGVASLLSLVLYSIEKGPKLYGLLKQTQGVTTARTTRDRVIGSIYAFLCALIWSLSYAWLTEVQRSLGTLTVSLCLFGLAALLYYIVSAATSHGQQPIFPVTQKSWRTGRMWILITANLGNFFLSVWALKYISASQANALNHFSPLPLAVALILRGRLKPSRGVWVGIVLAIVGIWMLCADTELLVRDRQTVIGAAIALGAGVSFALWTWMMSEIEEEPLAPSDRYRMMAHIFFVSYALTVTWAFFASVQFTATPKETVVLLVNGVRVAVVYILFQHAIARAGAMLSALIVIFQVQITFIFDRWLNGVNMTGIGMVGSVLIMAAAFGLQDDVEERRRVASDGSVEGGGG